MTFLSPILKNVWCNLESGKDRGNLNPFQATWYEITYHKGRLSILFKFFIRDVRVFYRKTNVIYKINNVNHKINNVIQGFFNYYIILTFLEDYLRYK